MLCTNELNQGSTTIGNFCQQTITWWTMEFFSRLTDDEFENQNILDAGKQTFLCVMCNEINS